MLTNERFRNSFVCDGLIASVVSLLNNGDTRTVGKIFAEWAEHVACDHLNSLGYDAKLDPSDGYDLKLKIGERWKRVQVKYRYVCGKTPYSRQLHFETTRRNSEKNLGDASTSGHVSYSVKEFDYVMPIIIHGFEKICGEDYLEAMENYFTMLIPVGLIEDDSLPGFCSNQISSKVLNECAGNLENFHD